MGYTAAKYREQGAMNLVEQIINRKAREAYEAGQELTEIALEPEMHTALTNGMKDYANLPTVDYYQTDFGLIEITKSWEERHLS